MARSVELTPFACTDLELALLGSILGGDVLPGLPDPVRGWFAVEVEEAFNKCGADLIRKGVVEPRPDGTIIVEMSVAMLLCTCVFARQIFILNYTPAGRRQRTRYYFVEQNLAVELARRSQTTSPPLYDLTPYNGVAALLPRITKGMYLQAQRAPQCPPGLLRESDLAQAKDVAWSDGADAAAALLQEHGLAVETATALARTLAFPLGNGALVAMQRESNDWRVNGVAILEGANGMWLLQPSTSDGVNWIEARPCPARELRDETARLVEGTAHEGTSA